MAHEPDLDRLTTLLGQCLGRIDERAYRLQCGDDDDELDGEHVLEQEASTLQELVDALVDGLDAPQQCDVGRIVRSAVDGCIAELDGAVSVRVRIATDLPPVGCAPSRLAHAVQRALVIAAGRLDRGGELVATVRRDGPGAVLELESRGRAADGHLQHRVQTLCEFVAALGGNCRVDADQRGDLLLALELPPAALHGR
jgi:hypothetical protein